MRTLQAVAVGTAKLTSPHRRRRNLLAAIRRPVIHGLPSFVEQIVTAVSSLDLATDRWAKAI